MFIFNVYLISKLISKFKRKSREKNEEQRKHLRKTEKRKTFLPPVINNFSKYRKTFFP